ncbi:MAG TPA: hypothetical protein VMM15_19320 [Bradyrhizobium sp.]|nr:hypothetical protein [Bradyrhizobium sp.]
MTIESTAPARKLPLAGLFAVASIWFSGMAIAATAVRPDAVVAFGAPARMIAAVARSDGYLLDAGRFYVAARTGPSTVRTLYAGGAWFVWPALARECGRP